VRGTLRLHLLSVVALAIAALIIPLGLIDHHHKQLRMNKAEVGEWYCAQLGTRCHGPSSASIEDHWNTREACYVALLVALTSFAALRVIVPYPARASRRRAGPLRRSSS
jgi:hypothetical protein